MSGFLTNVQQRLTALYDELISGCGALGKSPEEIVDSDGVILEEYPELKAKQAEMNALDAMPQAVFERFYRYGDSVLPQIEYSVSKELLEGYGFDEIWITDPIRLTAKAQIYCGEYNGEAIGYEYWKKKLSENKSYQYIGIFADEGLSGKSMKNRAELNEMLDLARKGQIDRIFVKSIARFARNYIETIETIRELRQLNIPVNFDEEGIDTNDPKCNLLLNVYASLAEEELRSMSENQKWSVRKRFENGSVEIGKMYGYEYIDGKLIVNPREAEAVRLIFKLYLEGYGYDKIAQKLEDEGYRTKYGKVMWASAAIPRMLKNEKYTGNALMQKYYNINMTQKKNNGELPQFYIENSHKAIISPEDYEKAQKQMVERAEKHLKHGAKRNSYPLSGKIVCGKCGKKYGRKIAGKGKSYECVKWMCRMKNEKTALACHNSEIKDSIVTELLINAYNEFLDKRKESNEVTIETDKLKKLLEDEKELKSLYARGYIVKEQYTVEQASLVEKIKLQENRIDKLTKGEVNYGRLSKAETLTAEVIAALEIIEVNNYTVTFKFINGYTVKNKYDNGRAGNVNGKLKIKT